MTMLETAEVVATYGRDFYAGGPAITVNHFGKGEAWYVAAAGADDRLLDAFHGALAQARKLKRALPDCDLPPGVTAQIRQSKVGKFIFECHVDGEILYLVSLKATPAGGGAR